MRGEADLSLSRADGAGRSSRDARKIPRRGQRSEYAIGSARCHAAGCFTVLVKRYTPQPGRTQKMSTTLTQQLDEYLAGWMQRVPAERRAAMERHIAHLSGTGLGRSAKQVGDQAPEILLPDAHGNTFEVAKLLPVGPGVVTFYRRSCLPYCTPQLKS